MLNVYFHIVSKFDCIMRFYVKDKEIFNVNTLGSLSDEIDLKIDDLENFEIKLYPFNKKNGKENIAYTAQFEIVNEKLICKNKQVYVFSLPQNHFIIQLNPINLQTNNFNDYDKIENAGSYIKTLKILPTINKKGEVEVYEINGDKANFKEKYYVSLLNKKHSVNNNIIKLLEFFEDLEFGSEENLLDNFSASLADKLSNETIKTFFGKFDEAKIINYYSESSVVLLNKTNQTAKVFSATFDKGLIDNIIEIE